MTTLAHPPRKTALPSRFAPELDALPLAAIMEAAAPGPGRAARAARALEEHRLGLPGAAALLAAEGEPPLEAILRRARDLTDRVFGRSILIYAPCYLSSFCVNHCSYCGFNFTAEIPRLLLSPDEAASEVSLLAARGIRRVLLVAGDYPGKVTSEYLAEVIAGSRALVPEIDLEVAPARTGLYRGWVDAGAGGVTCYQETYNPFSYEENHPRGPKVHYEQRLGALERAGAGGMRRLGLGILLGLAEPIRDLVALIAHARFLSRRHPAARVTVSLPRLRPAVPGFTTAYAVGDEDLVRYYAVLRLALPEAGLVVSTREPPEVRRRLLEAGITQMSAGSVTVPGGYGMEENEGPQFEIADHRPVEEVVADLGGAGYAVRWTAQGAR